MPVSTPDIVALLKKKPLSFGELMAAMKIETRYFRTLDQRLQAARRAGVVKFDREKRKWVIP